MSEMEQLEYVFSLCDIGDKGFITRSDILRVGSHYGSEIGRIFDILRLGEGDRLTLEDFIERVSEPTNVTLIDDDEYEEDRYEYSGSSPDNTATSGFISSIGDFESDVEVKGALKRIEDQLHRLKECQSDSRHELSLILESVSAMEKRKDDNKEELKRLLSGINDKEVRSQKVKCDSYEEKIGEKNDQIYRLTKKMEESEKRFKGELEELRLENETLKLRNAVLERKSDSLEVKLSDENEEIQRQWRDIRMDKERVADERLGVGFDRISLVTEQEELALERKDLEKKRNSNRSLSLTLPSSTTDKSGLRTIWEEIKLELYREKKEASALRKKSDPFTPKNELIREYKRVLERRREDERRYSGGSNLEPVSDDDHEDFRKKVLYEKRCLSLVIDDLKIANERLTNNLRNLEKQNVKLKNNYPESRNRMSNKERQFGRNVKSKSFVQKLSAFSKSMSALNAIQ